MSNLRDLYIIKRRRDHSRLTVQAHDCMYTRLANFSRDIS